MPENSNSVQIETYVKEHRSDFLKELCEFLKIPSISSLSEHKENVRKGAEWIADALTKAGLEHVEIVPTERHPIVCADWLHAPGKPTALIYGHYDVQPVDPENLWTTPPFEPSERDGKLYARGASDDKGPLFMHVKAVEAFLKTTGTLPVNVKFCIEGEEEIGSPNLPSFIENHKDKLKADAVVISDSPMLEKGRPSIVYGLRGLCALQINVRGAKSDLHSGLYGGGVPNSIHVLVELLASMHDQDGRAAVEGFYDRVAELTEAEKKQFESLQFDEQKLQKELELPALFGEKGYTYLERTWTRPTLEINGIYGGFQGEGTKTVIPSAAHAKITCRLVPDQNPEEIMQLIERHVRKHTPAGVTVEVVPFDTGNPFVAPTDHPALQAASTAYKKGYGVSPVFIRGGGSIPIVENFSRVLQVPVVLMGFSLPDENFHAPNEFFTLDNFDKGLLTMYHYWEELGATQL